MISNRKIFLIVFLLCALSILYAFYAQYYQNIAPCPLCIAERLTIGIIAVFSLLFALHNPKNILVRIYGIIILGMVAFGIKIVARHLWIMSLPPEQQPVSCGMPLDVMFQRVPLHQFLGYILKGDAECAKVNWSIFGISAPMAVAILLGLVGILALFVVFSKTKKQ